MTMKRVPDSPVAKEGFLFSSHTNDWSPLWIFSLLLLVSLAAYWPALGGNFLWDDSGHVTHPALQSWSGLWRIWSEPGATQQYYPLLHSAFWFEHHLWGDATLGYHLVNVVFHACSACLLVIFLRRLCIPGALLAGMVFALHPVCVESVAWISEQKNTLSTLFYLAAALAWIRFEADRKPARYLVALFLFLAALLSKSVTATLPAALLVVAWWRRGRLSLREDVFPLLPWFVFGLSAGLGTAWLEASQIGAAGADFTLGFSERFLLSGRIVWFYLGKLVWPTELTFFYPRWSLDQGALWQWLLPVGALGVLVGFGVWSKRNRGPLAAALLFGGTLVPVLGFVNVYPFVFSYVADHFQYLACLGLLVFLSAVLARVCSSPHCPRWCGSVFALALLFCLGSLSWWQCGLYRDVVSLYETTLRRNPNAWVAHLNLGIALEEAGRVTEALPHLRRSLELKPDFPETLNTLGNVLNLLGRGSEALPLLDQALHLQPQFAEAHNTRGVVLMTLGNRAAGISEFRRALELKPALVLARVNLGWGLANQGLVVDALPHFEQACRLAPDSVDAELKWGLTLAMSGRVEEALPHLSRAAELQPDRADIHFALASALADLGQAEEAQVALQETLRLAPSHVAARQALRLLLQARSR